MNDPCTPTERLRYADAHRILAIAEGALPFPKLSEDRATFFFVGYPAADVPQLLGDAHTILVYALGAVFKERRTNLGSASHYILTAKLPSGLLVELVALAEHIDAAHEDTRNLVAV